jgi:hypothetical protein
MLTKPSLGLAMCALVATAAVASAQSSGQRPQRPERPYRGLFGGGARPSGDHALTADFQVGGGYDDSGLSEGIATPTWEGGSFGYFSADLAYSFNKPRVNFGATLASTSRYIHAQPADFVSSHIGRVGLSVERRRTRLTLGQTVGYQPFLTLMVFPVLIDPELGEAHPADPNQGTPLDAYMSYDSNVEVHQQTSRRGELVFSYGYRMVDFDDAQRDSAIHSIGGRYGHEVLRDLKVRAGYGFSEARYPETSAFDDVRRHTIDVGIDYNRALSLSRRTTFSFQTGGAALSDSEQMHYRVIGGARLNHEMARTWSAGVGFSRNVEFLESLVDPYYSDAFSAGLTGMLTPRLEFDALASAATGTIGFSDTGDNGLTTYSTNVGLTYGLTRYLALAASHTFYHYAFDSGVDLPLGLASLVDRQTVLVTLNVWLPLLSSPRSANASR